MAKRDLIKEILEFKNRNDSIKELILLSKITKIQSAFQFISKSRQKNKSELYKYIPISLIACFQSFTRDIISKLIDSRAPYTNNISKINQIQNIKLDLSILSALSNKKLTSGEFIAHLIPCNNLTDFNRSLSIITDSDFLKALKEFQNSDKNPLSHFYSDSNDFEKALEIIQNTFELRHILCHEFAINTNLTKKETGKMLVTISIFLFQTNTYISSILNPDFNKSQEELIEEIENELINVEKELEELVKEIVNKNNSSNLTNFFDEEIFIDSIIKWKEYVSTKIKAQFDIFEKSKLDFFTTSLKINETKKKIDELKQSYKPILTNKPKKISKSSMDFKIIKQIISDRLTD